MTARAFASDQSAPVISVPAGVNQRSSAASAPVRKRRRRFLSGAEAAELRWFTPAGTEMTAADWSDPNALAVTLYLDGSDAPDLAEDGTPLLDDDFLVLVNAWWERLDFVLPATRADAAWQVELDSYDPTRAVAGQHAGDRLTVCPRSIVVLSSVGPR